MFSIQRIALWCQLYLPLIVDWGHFLTIRSDRIASSSLIHLRLVFISITTNKYVHCAQQHIEAKIEVITLVRF